MAYLGVAQKLIDPAAEVPELVAVEVANELAKIDAHVGFEPSGIFIYKEDYSQYVPRGHYTRSEELKRYFKTLMWYGRMAFLLKGSDDWGPVGEALISVYDAKIQTTQAVLLAESIEQVQVGERTGRGVWDRIYAVTSFYVGLADDLTPYEYLGAVDKVFGNSFVPADLEDENNFFTLKAELALHYTGNETCCVCKLDKGLDGGPGGVSFFRCNRQDSAAGAWLSHFAVAWRLRWS